MVDDELRDFLEDYVEDGGFDFYIEKLLKKATRQMQRRDRVNAQ